MRKLASLTLIVVVAILAIANVPNTQVLAHGSMSNPVSRVYACFLEGPESPDTPACQFAVSTGGTQPLYDWPEVNIANAAGNHQALIPDGKLCSANRTKYAAFDSPRTDWPSTAITSGSRTFTYAATAPHVGSFTVYITNTGYNPSVALRWADLTQIGMVTNPPLSNGAYTFTMTIPSRTGRHLIYSIWQRSDSPEAFYTCSDVVFGGGTNPTTVPPTPTSSGGCFTPYVHGNVYTGGMTVSYNGRNWRAKWWTQNEFPSTGGSGVWEDLGACGGGTVPTNTPGAPTATRTRTNTPVGPTATRTNTPVGPTATRTRTNTSVPPTNPPPTNPPPTNPPPTSTGGSCFTPYVHGNVYTGGMTVSYNGRNWRAKWWTQNEAPSTGGSGVWEDLGACSTTPTNTPVPPTRTNTPGGPTSIPPTNVPGGGQIVLGYFVEWGIYQRAYHPKNIVTSGSASKLTHINFAFGNVTNGACVIGDSFADYDKAYTAAESVDGVADTWDQPLRGLFNQFRKLKAAYPHIKILYSFGGWTWSGGFGQAAANATAFANSCYNLVEDPRWADVFDGIDIDWEYPNACGLSCDTSGPAAFRTLMSALRTRFGSGNLVTAAITADGSNGGKIDAADYGGASQFVNWYNVMTYDYFGTWAASGPTAPHSPLTAYPGIPADGFNTDAAIQKLKSKGVPANKLLIGIGFYGRGWTGVSQSAPGGSASGAAPGTYEAGNEDYKVLVTKCPSTSTIAGTAYAFCPPQWWSYDTPNTIASKMTYKKQQGLGGAFFWELTGDTTSGALITAMYNNR